MGVSKEGLSIHGFSRVTISNPDGKIVGDSGFVGPNQITNLGFQNYLGKLLGGSSGSVQVGYIALGTGTAPATDGTVLPGEIMDSTQRQAVTFTMTDSNTAQFLATFASSDNFLSGSVTLSNVGLFNTTSTGDTLFAGNTYSGSSCDTNQNVNVTYQIRFS